jgi:hypothetical protein
MGQKDPANHEGPVSAWQHELGLFFGWGTEGDRRINLRIDGDDKATRHWKCRRARPSSPAFSNGDDQIETVRIDVFMCAATSSIFIRSDAAE